MPSGIHIKLIFIEAVPFFPGFAGTKPISNARKKINLYGGKCKPTGEKTP